MSGVLRIDPALLTNASDAHRRNYLFRIATNLVRDGRRRRRLDLVAVPEETDRDALRNHDDVAGRTVLRADLRRAMANLSSREQALLWLAYAQGSSHDEIAESLGLKTSRLPEFLPNRSVNPTTTRRRAHRSSRHARLGPTVC